MLCAGASWADPPVVDGRFTIRFTEDLPHKVCVMAPCPTGTYTVEVSGREIVQARFAEVAPGTADSERGVIEAFLRQNAFKVIVVDGEVWFLRERSRIVIRVRRVEGEPRR